MKKSAFLLALSLVILVAGCGKDKIDITDTSFDIESCSKYFELMDCILDNDNDETYSQDMRDQLRQEVKDMQAEWEGLDEKLLAEQCSNELEKFVEIEDRLQEIGCSAN